MWVDVAASHAGAQTPVAANLIIQWAHIVASGVWIGGLLVLLLAVRGQPSEIKAAPFSVSRRPRGSRSSSSRSPGHFVPSSRSARSASSSAPHSASWCWSRWRCSSILAVLGASIASAMFRKRRRSLRGLRRVGSTEVVIGAAVVLVAAALVNVAPPVASTAFGIEAQTSQLVVTGSDFATTVKVRLTVSPGTAGSTTSLFASPTTTPARLCARARCNSSSRNRCAPSSANQR